MAIPKRAYTINRSKRRNKFKKDDIKVGSKEITDEEHRKRIEILKGAGILKEESA